MNKNHDDEVRKALRERSVDVPLEENLIAIYILDGGLKPIDWRDRSQPELLRKLCEHLEYFESLRDSNAKWQERIEQLAEWCDYGGDEEDDEDDMATLKKVYGKLRDIIKEES